MTRTWEDLDPATQSQVERLEDYMSSWGYKSGWSKFEAIRHVLGYQITSLKELKQFEVKQLLRLYGGG